MRTAVIVTAAALLLPLTATAAGKPNLQHAGQAIGTAITREQALARELQQGHRPPDADFIAADHALTDTITDVTRAYRAGEIALDDANAIVRKVHQIRDKELAAEHLVLKKRYTAAADRYRATIALKEKVRAVIAGEVAGDTPAPAAKRCEATKEFDVYAIPAGFAGAYADVYPHGVPKDAKHIEFSFVDTATGKAPAPQLFPGQTWKATNKGFLPDGRLDIRVDVTGTGFGAQDANKKHWKVVVTYDC